MHGIEVKGIPHMPPIYSITLVFSFPCQDVKFHELLLLYDPSLKDTGS
jgi:hypothetical protein